MGAGVAQHREPPGGRLNRPDARRASRLKYAAHPGFKIVLFLVVFGFEYEPLTSSPGATEPAFKGPSRGCSLSKCFRSAGFALAIACRTTRRCTPCFFASPLVVSPAEWPRWISSNNSTFSLLSIPEMVSFPGCQGWAL
jgi:hypothetical protein